MTGVASAIHGPLLTRETLLRRSGVTGVDQKFHSLPRWRKQYSATVQFPPKKSTTHQAHREKSCWIHWDDFIFLFFVFFLLPGRERRASPIIWHEMKTRLNGQRWCGKKESFAIPKSFLSCAKSAIFALQKKSSSRKKGKETRAYPQSFQSPSKRKGQRKTFLRFLFVVSSKVSLFPER